MEKNKNLLRMKRMNADRTRGMVANILRSSVPLRFKGFAFALCFTPRLKASVVGFCFLIFGHFGNSLRCRQKYFSTLPVLRYNKSMTHQQLVRMAEQWLRTRYRCGIVLSEQSCASGETPDVIAWKGKCRSVVVECKVSRADFFADQEKPFRKDPELGMGCERFYLVPQGLIAPDELPKKWGLLECKGREVRMAVKPCRQPQRSQTGLMWEMNLLLASLRRVEVRIEPQTITDFLKWKNRLAEYNGGRLPEGIVAPEAEPNVHLV
jgi:hypothetical protein